MYNVHYENNLFNAMSIPAAKEMADRDRKCVLIEDQKTGFKLKYHPAGCKGSRCWLGV